MKPRLLLLLGLALVAMLFVPAASGADPVPATIVAGKKVVFSFTVEKGTPPFACQWNKDGQPIAGATGQTYTIAKVAESDAGVYTVTVSNSAGSTLSDEAPIVLIVPPSGVHLTKTVSEPDPT